jgi:hypothetical protein
MSVSRVRVKGTRHGQIATSDCSQSCMMFVGSSGSYVLFVLVLVLVIVIVIVIDDIQEHAIISER